MRSRHFFPLLEELCDLDVNSVNINTILSYCLLTLSKAESQKQDNMSAVIKTDQDTQKR